MNFFASYDFCSERFRISGRFRIIGDAAHAELNDFFHRGQLRYAEHPGSVIEIALRAVPGVEVRIDVHYREGHVVRADNWKADAVVAAQDNRKRLFAENLLDRFGYFL